MTDVLSIGRLLVRQRELNKQDILSVTYDLVIITVTWETRNPTALQMVGGCRAPTLLIRFSSTKPSVNSKKDANQAELQLLCPNHKLLELGASIEFDANSEILQAEIRDGFVKKGAPLRVLIDISCMPKSYVGFLCGLGFGSDYVCRLDCLYSEGAYNLSETTSQGGPLSVISEGEWSSIQIPYLEANETFPSERGLLVVLGGEIGYSLPFIERYEPKRLGLIFIRDDLNAYIPVGSEKAAYIELTSGPNLVKAEFNIEDMIGVLDYVHRFCSEQPTQTVVGLAIGSKSQSLALALAAIDLENLEVVCRIPSAYSDKDVAPTGRVFLYEIEDRFEPMGYLD
jgi:hypothetical protein